jgi:DNA-binding MarR family transcriptional regulator
MSSDPLDSSEVDPRRLDVVLAALLAGLALNERVADRIRAAGFADVRFSHGFVFQHLVPGPLPVGELARRMGVSQQAASKSAAELERLGYVERVADPSDARVRRLALSARGRAAVAAGRAARAEVAGELEGALGPRRTKALRAALLDALEFAGGAEAVRARRVPPIR